MEGDEGSIISRASDWKLFILLKIKVKQNLGCPNKEYSVIVKHISMIGKIQSHIGN